MQKSNHRALIRNTVIILLVVTAAILGMLLRMGMLQGLLSRDTPVSQQTATSAGQNTKGQLGTTHSGSNLATDTPAPGSIKENTADGTTLLQPTGTFVSAHKSIPLSASLSSVCNTSSGATCQIVFTSDSGTHSLPAETTDLGGSAYWNSWTPRSIGLTPGSWHVKAVATLRGNSKSNDDALALEVTP